MYIIYDYIEGLISMLSDITMICYQTLSLALKHCMIGNNIVLPDSAGKLYGSTHSLTKISVGTWRSLHHAMVDLKTYTVTLSSSLFFKGLALHCLVSSRSWEARLFLFYSSILCVMKCCNSSIRVEWCIARVLLFFCKSCIVVGVVLLCQ